MKHRVNDLRHYRTRLKLLEDLIQTLIVWSRSKTCKELHLTGFKILNELESEVNFDLIDSESLLDLENAIISRVHTANYATQALECLDYLITECNSIIEENDYKETLQNQSLNNLLNCLNFLNDNLQLKDELDYINLDYDKYLNFSTYYDYFTCLISKFISKLRANNYNVKKQYCLSKEETRKIFLSRLLIQGKPCMKDI